MTDAFAPLTTADLAFLIGLIDSYVNFTDDRRLQALLRTYEETGTPEARKALETALSREIRYLGSSELAYAGRYLLGREPGVSFREITRDVAHALKVPAPPPGTDRQCAEYVVEGYVTREFAALSPEEQQRMLEDLGVAPDRAAAFLKRSAGVFALPMFIQAFSTLVVEGLLKKIILGTIARLLGSRAAQWLFQVIVGRFPWWIGWIGPAAWTLSIGWTTLDLQGPALRKTIPIVLYLGLCGLRERYRDEGVSDATP